RSRRSRRARCWRSAAAADPPEPEIPAIRVVNVPENRAKGEQEMTLRTFELPGSVSGTTVDRILGRQLVRTWETDGIFQVAATAEQDRITGEALTASRRFFARSLPEKAK